MTIKPSLLPPNSTALERALEQASARLGDVPAPVKDLWNPATCPLELLPWLAWALSADRWEIHWSEAQKREAVARAIELQRKKGTPASLDAVLASFDALLKLTEWFEMQPVGAPHTFTVELPLVMADGTTGGFRTSAEFAEAIIRDVSRTKPLRSHFVLIQSLAAECGVRVIGAGRTAGFHRMDCLADTELEPVWDEYLQTELGEPIVDELGDPIEAAMPAPPLYSFDFAAQTAEKDGEAGDFETLLLEALPDFPLGELVAGEGWRYDKIAGQNYFGTRASFSPPLVAAAVAGGLEFVLNARTVPLVERVNTTWFQGGAGVYALNDNGELESYSDSGIQIRPEGMLNALFYYEYDYSTGIFEPDIYEQSELVAADHSAADVGLYLSENRISATSRAGLAALDYGLASSIVPVTDLKIYLAANAGWTGAHNRFDVSGSTILSSLTIAPRAAIGETASPPANTVAPAISGAPVEGETLEASSGDWTAAPTAFAYQWTRDGAPIAGATASSYVLTAADAGAAIACTVTATNGAGSSSASSASVTASALELDNSPHEQWRVLSLMTAGGGSYSIGAAEIQMRETPGGPDVTSPAFAITDDEQLAAANCYDNDPATFWQCYAGAEAIRYNGQNFGTGNAKNIRELVIVAHPTNYERTPHTFALQFNDPGAPGGWRTKMLVRTTWTANGETQTFTVPADPALSPAARHWAILSLVDHTISVDELELRETPGGPDVSAPGMPAFAGTTYAAETIGRAFDDTAGTLYANTRGTIEFLGIDLGTPRDIVQLAWRARNDGYATVQSPEAGAVFSSTDGRVYVRRFGWAGLTPWAAGETKLISK